MTKKSPPIGQAKGKKAEVQAMFNDIAPHYDFLNRLLSLGIDRRWRNQVINSLREEAPKRILDVATGTADLAIAALELNPDTITGVDISEEMLNHGREKLKALKLDDRIQLRQGDSERLPFSDNQFDAVLVAFGVRNFENLQKGLAQMLRVLKPGGAVVVLEFSKPRRFPVKQLFNMYFKYVLPVVGGVVSKNKGAYQYLPDSVQAFPEGNEFLEEMRKAGFKDPVSKTLTFGVASMYKAHA